MHLLGQGFRRRPSDALPARLPRALCDRAREAGHPTTVCRAMQSPCSLYLQRQERAAVHDRCRDRLPLRRASLQASPEEKEERHTPLRLCRLWRWQTQRSSDQRLLSSPLRNRERIPTIASSARPYSIKSHRTAVVVNRAGADVSQPLCPSPREMGDRHSLWLAHLSPGRDIERSGDCVARANSIATRLFAGILLPCAGTW